MIGFLECWAFMAPLIWTLTQSSPDPDAERSLHVQPSSEEIPTWITVKFSTMPQSYRISHGETPLLSNESPDELTSEFQKNLPIDSGPILLDLEVVWPPSEGQNVVSVSLTPDGYREQDSTI